MRVLRTMLCTAVGAVIAVGASPVSAQPTPARPAAAGTAARPGAPGAATAGAPAVMGLRDALSAARSSDPQRVIAGIEALGSLKAREALPTIVEALHNGPTDAVTERAIEVLGNLALPDAIPELSLALHHRRAAVRSKAIDALAYIRDDRVRPLIESGLHDSDRQVRGAAALALLKINARPSVSLLFRAFDRGVPEAAEAIGALGEAAVAVSNEPQADREDPRSTTRTRTLAMYLGRTPLSVLLPGFKRFLNRRDVPVPIKVKIIERLEAQASLQVRDFLRDWVRGLPVTYNGPDKERANRAILQIVAPAGGKS